MSSSRPISLKASISLGIAYALVLSGIAAVSLRDEGGSVGGLELATILGLYFGGAISGGVLFWVAQVFRDSAPGRALIGFICILPLGSLTVIVAPGDYSIAARVSGALVTAALIGGGIGLSVGEHPGETS